MVYTVVCTIEALLLFAIWVLLSMEHQLLRGRMVWIVQALVLCGIWAFLSMKHRLR